MLMQGATLIKLSRTLHLHAHTHAHIHTHTYVCAHTHTHMCTMEVGNGVAGTERGFGERQGGECDKVNGLGEVKNDQWPKFITCIYEIIKGGKSRQKEKKT